MIKLAERYGIPKTITREGQKCRLVKITVHEGDIVEAAYLKPEPVHSIDVDVSFDFGKEELPPHLVNQAK